MDSLQLMFGDIVQDNVTGYVGEVTAVCIYANGDEPEYRVESLDSTGRPIEVWLPQTRLMMYEGDEDKCDS